MTASYTRPDKTRDKFYAQIWVVYYACRDEFTHPFIKARPPANVAPIESAVLAQSGKNKHVNETGSANQKQAFKHRVIFQPAKP